MIKKEFVGLTKNSVVRKALSFWYKEYKDYWTLRDFLAKCTYREESNEVVIIFRGPAPPKKKSK
jgi:hypothetical protein